MSRNKLWQNYHKNLTANQLLTKTLVRELRRLDFPPKQVALDLDLPTERVRNWYYKNVGMTAYDLLLLMHVMSLCDKLCFKWLSNVGNFRNETARPSPRGRSTAEFFWAAKTAIL